VSEEVFFKCCVKGCDRDQTKQSATCELHLALGVVALGTGALAVVWGSIYLFLKVMG